MTQRPGLDVIGGILSCCQGVLGKGRLAIGFYSEELVWLCMPGKLVDKIRSGQFVEMRELLMDSISLIQQLEAFGTHTSLPTLPGVVQPSLREVSCIASLGKSSDAGDRLNPVRDVLGSKPCEVVVAATGVVNGEAIDQVIDAPPRAVLRISATEATAEAGGRLPSISWPMK